MRRELEKNIGRTVTVIYQGRDNGFSKRRIKILSVDGMIVKAFCFERKEPRTFLISSFLAIESTSKKAAKIS